MKTTYTTVMLLVLFLVGCTNSAAVQEAFKKQNKVNGAVKKQFEKLEGKVDGIDVRTQRMDENITRLLEKHARPDTPHIPSHTAPVRFQYEGLDITVMPGYGDDFWDGFRRWWSGQAEAPSGLIDRFDQMCLARVQRIRTMAAKMDEESRQEVMGRIVALLKKSNANDEAALERDEEMLQKLQELLDRKPSTAVLKEEVIVNPEPDPALLIPDRPLLSPLPEAAWFGRPIIPFGIEAKYALDPRYRELYSRRFPGG